ncbi:hypothetical protein [Ramlibacter tataouinensis]|uniref:Alpha/beta hydrolase n=1 Tax=Ramlibacter tataouinensis (strain ATCC BAA-407 / DSM 14655 / LMG 21543 / TTB310) TaxID=365046 RepID=F5Y4K5_RAMTT|nr:hypothetical protein [Ramlibacter tataouinensis]AEG91323.1 Conserved hypothetical protein [Ramlibacter tataouinensis TTB310]
MSFVHHRWPGPGAATQLWLMLPGAYMKPADFVQAGFVQALHARGLAHDVALLDANVAEVADGSALLRLQDFLRREAPPGMPLRLLGISLGAHLAMLCLAQGDEAARRADGAVLLAPYLGPRDVVAEVATAGLAQWSPACIAGNDVDRRIWRWLQRDAARHELHLGYGADDRFAPAHALMAQALPPQCVDVQPGDHAWPVWTQLWQRHLERTHGR